MSTTLASGANTTITLPAGQVLYTGKTGKGTAVIGPGPQANQTFALGTGARIGPYNNAVSVFMTSMQGAIDYQIGDAIGVPPGNPILVDPLAPSLSGAGADAVAGVRRVVFNARASAVMGAVQVMCDGPGRGRVIGDVRALVPLPPAVEATQYYVNRAAANDSGDGLTWATAKQKISSAITLGNTAAVPYTVNVAAGTYDRNYALSGASGAAATVPTQPCRIRAFGGAVICHAGGALSWTLEAGTTYKATRSNVSRVLDWLTRDADGEVTELTKVTTLVACTSTPGTWYTDNTTVYVNRADGAVVADANTTALILNVDGFKSSTGGNIWLEGITQYGGGSGALHCVGSASHRLLAVDCRFGFPTRTDAMDAVQSLDLDLFVGLRTIASHGTKDGFNFHIASAKIPKAVLVDCTGFGNGVGSTSTSCNGVTMHDGGLLIDVNGRWYSNYGADAAHVNADTEAWHIGSQGYDGFGDLDRSSGETPSETAFLAGDEATVRLFGCVGQSLATGGGTVVSV